MNLLKILHMKLPLYRIKEGRTVDRRGNVIETFWYLSKLHYSWFRGFYRTRVKERVEVIGGQYGYHNEVRTMKFHTRSEAEDYVLTRVRELKAEYSEEITD